MVAYQWGDEYSFAELYSRHSTKVLGFIKSRIKNDEVSTDIFQATFLKLHKSKHLYNSSLPFSPWLFTICRNELIDYLRTQKNIFDEFNEDNISPPTPTSKIEQDIDFSSLNKDQKMALEMRYTDDSTFEEIATALNTSPTNARKIISRSVKYLRGIYAKKQ